MTRRVSPNRLNRPPLWLTSMGLAALAMYAFDPDQGRRRRRLLRDQVVHAVHLTGKAVGTTARDLYGRTQGVIAETRKRFRHEPVSDSVLVERVRANLGQVVSHPHAIDVTAREGCVGLTGPILAREERPLLRRIRSVPGVRDIDNRLERHQRPDDVPALQGGVPRRVAPELLQVHWSPTARLLVGAAGLGMVRAGLGRSGPIGIPVSLIGLGLLARALTNLQLKRLIGIGAGRRAIVIHKTLNIDAPVERVFEFWSHFENFPKVMSHLKEVTDIGDGRSHWTAAGPAGLPVEWNAELTQWVTNKVIAWKSVPGWAIQNSGIIRFFARDSGTTVEIRLSYNPPGGALGHAFAALLGADPKRALNDDLMRAKSFIETGKATAHGQTVVSDERGHPTFAPPDQQAA